MNLLGLDGQALAEFFAQRGEKPFRAQQVLRWVHQRLAGDVAAMSDLPRPLRDALGVCVTIDGPAVIRDSTSADGTRKWLLDAGSGNAVEAVYIPEGDRDDDPDAQPSASAIPVRVSAGRPRFAGPAPRAATRYRGTLCVSSQAGCALDCAFCSTGKQGFNRNLSTAEIVGQLWLASKILREEAQAGPASATGRPERELRPLGGQRSRDSGERGGPSPITNVVMMGMGEPLANFDNVVPALRLMLDDRAYGLSRRRVTLSTSGIVPMIDRLREACPVALAVSLHAPNDALRDRLVPINRKHPLRELMAACLRYLPAAPRDFVTFEYVMLDGVNDSIAHADELVALVRDVPCKMNLIPFNPFPGSEFRTSPRARIVAFQQRLQEAGLVTTVRKTRGDDIAAACGQLAGQVKDRTRRRLATRIVAAPAP